MQFNIKNQRLLIAAAFFVSSPAFAVDLVGVHDLAVKNDPQLQRKRAPGMVKSIADSKWIGRHEQG
jgi:hypothetical protein